jgi:hypothetical protein
MIETGWYRHYKGQYYKVLGLVQHSEENQPYVLYQPLYGEQKLWVRPLQMFTEQVLVDGQSIERFSKVEHLPSELMAIAANSLCLQSRQPDIAG